MGLDSLFGKIFGGGKSEAPAPIAPRPLPQPPKASSAKEDAEAVTRKRRVAQTRSVFTSPLGSSGEANVARKKLLGE